MSRVAYLGSFPPPYGGVTVKNALLFEEIASLTEVMKVDLSAVKRRSPAETFHFVWEMLSPSGALVVGTSDSWRRRITGILARANRKKMGRSVVFVMGGARLTDVRYVRELSNYKAVFVETDGMKRNYEEMGLGNVRLFPNCRKRPTAPVVPAARQGRLSCVYFSLVSEEKGALLVLDVARKLPDVNFHFYGRIDPAISDVFMEGCERLPNVRYHGVFDSVGGDVVAELSQYDVHLFPSEYPNEGVPGVLVETKMAGVPTVASERCHNGEIVQDGSEGFVLECVDADSFAAAVSRLDSDRSQLLEMKRAALASADQFYVDRYIGEIVDVLAPD